MKDKLIRFMTNIKVYRIMCALMFVICFVVGYSVTYVIKHYDEITYVAPPANPPYPSDADSGTERFDESTYVTMNEQVCRLEYEDGTVIEFPRATNKEVKILNDNLDRATTRWINLGSGTCVIVYEFELNGMKYAYYQHLVDYQYVFLHKQPI